VRVCVDIKAESEASKKKKKILVMSMFMCTLKGKDVAKVSTLNAKVLNSGGFRILKLGGGLDWG